MSFFTETWAKIKNVFDLPTAELLANVELAEAKRSLLAAQSAQDYAKRMVYYHADRIKRLNTYLANTGDKNTGDTQ